MAGRVAGIIQGQIPDVYPLVVGVAGEFGQRVSDALASSVLADVERKAVRAVGWDELSETVTEVRSNRFRQAVLPTRARAPEWAMLVGHASGDALDGLDERLAEVEGLTRFVALLVGATDEDRAAALGKASKLSKDGVFTFLLAEEGQDGYRRTLGDLAAGLVAFVLEGWRRHQRVGAPCAGNVRQSLSLAGRSESVFTLGVGRLMPDAAYHARRRKGKLSHLVWKALDADSSPCATPRPAVVASDIKDLLPEEAFDSEVKASVHGPHLRLPEGTRHIQVDCRTKPRTSRPSIHLHRLRAFLQWLRQVDDFYRHVELPACIRLTRLSTRLWGAALHRKWQGALAVPARVEGVLRYYRDVLDGWSEFWTGITRIQIGNPARSKVDEDLRTIRRHADAVPAPGGILLRSLLVAVALAWLCIGCFVWTNVWPWEDSVLLRVCVACAVGLLLVPGGGLWSYWRAKSLCIQAVQRARRDVSRRHVTHVLTSLKQGLDNAAGNGLSAVRQESTSFSEFRIRLEEGFSQEGQPANSADDDSGSSQAQGAGQAENQAPAFPDGCLDAPMEAGLRPTHDRVLKRLPEMLRQAIERAADDGALWRATLWCNEIRGLCQEELEAQVRTISFADAAQGAHLQASVCIQMHVMPDANLPAFRDAAGVQAQTPFLFAPATWNWQDPGGRQELLGQYDTTIVIPADGRPDLLAVAPIPINPNDPVPSTEAS